jgi:pimeloyl-ACP methyl ester carboxylesterase
VTGVPPTSSRWSRRSVLALGAAGALTACAGSRTRAARVEHRRGSVTSAHAPGEVRWRLALPPEVSGLVVVLHGKGGDADSAFDDLRLDDHVASTGLAVGSVDGGTSYWHPRRDGTDTGAVVVDDLLPLLVEETGWDGRVGLLGWSMGGYGALLLAAALGPDRVGAVVAQSAALWTEPGASAPGAFDDREDFEAHDVFDPARLAALAQLPVRLDCGEDDPFAVSHRAFGAALPSAELTIDAGGHDVAYWRGHAADQMRWLAERLA